MSKYTPGPWSCFVSIHGDDRTVDDCIHSESKSAGAGDIICLSPERDGYEESAKRWDENARLIAAAPELLEACIKAREWLEGWASADPYIGVLDAAIAKATGGES